MVVRSNRICVLALLACTACGEAPKQTSSAVPGTRTTALTAGNLPSSGGTAERSPKLEAKKEALLEIVAREPDALPPTAINGTLVGTETGLSAEVATAKPAPTDLRIRQNLRTSSMGSEHDLRATVYFDMVEQCRAPDGSRLPPEVIDIEMRIDPHGYIDRSSVKATPLSPEYADAARCMVRIIRMANARFAPSRLEAPTAIKTLVPSVD